MISKGRCNSRSQRLYWWRKEAQRRRECYPRSLGSLVAKLGADPRPPDAQTHVLPSGSCSWSKALGLLSWGSPVLALPWQKDSQQGCSPTEMTCSRLQWTQSHILKPKVACCNLTEFLLSPDTMSPDTTFNTGNLGGPGVPLVLLL